MTEPNKQGAEAAALAVLEKRFERPLRAWEITAFRAALTAAIGADSTKPSLLDRERSAMDVTQRRAIEGERISDAVLAWMVKYDLLDAGNEYHVSDVLAVLDDLAPSDRSAAIGAGGQAVDDLDAVTVRKIIGHSGFLSTYPIQGQIDDAALSVARQILALYTHPAPSGHAVAVRPLVFRDGEARTAFGSSYTVHRRADGMCEAVGCGSFVDGPHTDMKAAKAAAQADYERRILSALSQPHPADERVVEAQWRDVETNHLLKGRRRSPAYFPATGEECEVSGPNCDDDNGYTWATTTVLWQSDIFVLYGQPGFWPALRKHEHVLFRPLSPKEDRS